MRRPERLVLDVFLFVLFLAASYPAVTGISLHEWLGLALVVPALLHLIVNWDWVLRTARRFAEKIRASSRVNLVVDALLFVSAVAVTVSGFAVSRTLAGLLGISTNASMTWHVLHALSADAVLGLFLLHTAVHWRWLADAARDVFTVEEPAYEPIAATTAPPRYLARTAPPSERSS